MSIWAEKQVFFLLQKLAYFTTKNDANKLKRYVFSKKVIESAKTQWRQANTVFSVKFGQKNLKNQKKNLNCADLPIFCQDNCQNTEN